VMPARTGARHIWACAPSVSLGRNPPEPLPVTSAGASALPPLVSSTLEMLPDWNGWKWLV